MILCNEVLLWETNKRNLITDDIITVYQSKEHKYVLASLPIIEGLRESSRRAPLPPSPPPQLSLCQTECSPTLGHSVHLQSGGLLLQHVPVRLHALQQGSPIVAFFNAPLFGVVGSINVGKYNTGCCRGWVKYKKIRSF